MHFTDHKYGLTACRTVILITAAMIACSVQVMAQTNDAKRQNFGLYAGLGPNYYFNNLVIGKSFVNSFNYSFTAKMMWEPEHLLSLGLESGYYRLYTLNSPAPNQVHIANSAIPIQLVVSMKFLKNFHFDFSMGRAILLNDATSETSGAFSTSAFSLADFSGTVGYRHQLGNRFSVGGEAKYYYSSSFVDKNVALMVMGGFRF
ncbi:hypothetical protein ACFGVR_20065 [Mucilaginibacter sp. AW1-3]